MIEICALASGSNGNCYYIGNQHDAILVDAGLSTKQLMVRFQAAGLDPAKVKAVFVSHEHSDHAQGIKVLNKRYGINIYMNSRTFYAMPKVFRPEHVRFFQPGDIVEVGSFTIHTFVKNHDAAEPCSFRIEHGGKSIGVFTDIGEPCEQVRTAVNQCHAVFMESNYDEKMLWEGKYPWYLKNRVSSAKGHLSNIQAFELMKEHGHPELECIFLSHISKENNTPELAMSTFNEFQSKTTVKLTSRIEVGEVYRMEKKENLRGFPIPV
jgi:phosphoribosyl 1,2-cyclic phosphodiesterase